MRDCDDAACQRKEHVPAGADVSSVAGLGTGCAQVIADHKLPSNDIATEPLGLRDYRGRGNIGVSPLPTPAHTVESVRG